MTTWVAAEIPSSAPAPKLGLAVKSTTAVRASSRPCWPTGIGPATTNWRNRSSPPTAEATSSAHSPRTAKTMPVTTPPRTTIAATNTIQVASAPGTRCRRRKATRGFSAAARTVAISSGITTSLSWISP